ncbi:hypothetical protein CS022_01600 [Veronia nyctiphanis]|uniref:Late embryogenesis abundant protein LEA-2 subgroup domain-containing protein n=1 Tax=Veronia nyctiphanis TaxID=1278244 RepID=A0A4Q0YUD1_9GAMM|nr:LEA type 2 family protein [Veronia nyctiphanis]RXJ74912.1 hypothetical protein CS022_01600 [Veronia nyctiphanis]
MAKKMEFEEPTFTYKDYDISNVTPQEVTAVFNVEAANPNAYGVNEIFADYELFVEGNRLVQGSKLDINLNANQTSDIQIPATIRYDELLKPLGAVTRQVLLGKASIPVDVELKIYGQPSLSSGFLDISPFPINRTIKKTIDIPIPKDKSSLLKALF